MSHPVDHDLTPGERARRDAGWVVEPDDSLDRYTRVDPPARPEPAPRQRGGRTDSTRAQNAPPDRPERLLDDEYMIDDGPDNDDDGDGDPNGERSAIWTAAGGIVIATGVGALVIFNLFGGVVLVASAAGVAVAGGAVAATRTANKHRRTAGGLGAGRRRKLLGSGSPRLGGARGRTGGPKLPKIGGGRGGGLPKLGGLGGRGRKATGAAGGPKLGGLGGRKATGAGKATGGPAKKATGAARTGGAGRGRTGGPKLPKLGLPKIGTGRGTGAARRGALLGKPTGTGRGASLLGRGRGKHAAPKATRGSTPKTTGTKATGPGAPTTTRGRIRQLREQGRQRRVANRQARWARADTRRQADRDWYRQWARGHAARWVARPARAVGQFAARNLIDRPGRAVSRAGRAAGGWVIGWAIVRPAKWVGRTLIGRPVVWLWRTAKINGWMAGATAWAWARTAVPAGWRHVKAAAAARRAALARFLRGAWLRQLARLPAFRGAAARWRKGFMASLTVMFAWLLRALNAPPTQPQPQAQPRPRTVPPAPAGDAYDADLDTDRPPATPPPAPTRPPAPTPAGRPAVVRPPAPVRTAATGGAMHPLLAKYYETAQATIGGFRPKSIPDLLRYLESQGPAMRYTGDHFGTLASTLAGRFPGAVLVRSYMQAVQTGHNDLAVKGHALHEGYRSRNAADIARHEQPRVNEHLADVARHAWGGTLPPMPGKGVMHEVHAMMLAASRDCFAAFWPGTYFDDAVLDLMNYLESLPLFFYHLSELHKDFADELVTQYPVEAGVHGYYYSYADGFVFLSDRAKALDTSYTTLNAGDVNRRLAPRPNEAWADAGNKAV